MDEEEPTQWEEEQPGEPTLAGPGGGPGWDVTGWLPSVGEAPSRTWSEEKGGKLWEVEEYAPGGFRWRQAPQREGAPVPLAAPTPFQGWAQDFSQIHGRAPQEKDWQDKLWMDSFVQQSGKLPTREDWVRHWYSVAPNQRNYAPEFVPFTNIGGQGGWNPSWGAPVLWPQGMDRWRAFDVLGLQGQQATPENRGLYNYSQRLIATANDWADWKGKADAIVSYLRRRREQPREEPRAAAPPAGTTLPAPRTSGLAPSPGSPAGAALGGLRNLPYIGEEYGSSYPNNPYSRPGVPYGIGPPIPQGWTPPQQPGNWNMPQYEMFPNQMQQRPVTFNRPAPTTPYPGAQPMPSWAPPFTQRFPGWR